MKRTLDRLRCRAACLAALSLLAAGGCAWHAQPPVRLPAQIARPDRAVLVMFVDGLDRSTLDRLDAKGELPHIRRFLLDRGVRVDRAVTTIPSITFAANVSLTTGLLPGRHGVTGNRWFDRDRLILHDYDGILAYDRVGEHFDAPTIFERLANLRTVTVLTPVHRGASRHFANWLSSGVTWFFGTMQQVDALTAHRMTQIAKEAAAAGRWPDVIWTCFVGPDVVGHLHGKDSRQYLAAVRNIDVQVGRIAAALEQAGMLDRTLLVMVSDHGHVVVGPRQHVDLRAVLTGRFGLKVAYDAKSDGCLQDREALFGSDRVAMVDCGNRRAVLHLRVGDHWRNRPDLAQIERFARDYPAPSAPGRQAPFWKALLEAVGAAGQLVAVRDGVNRVLVCDGRGSGLVERSADGASGRKYRYRVLEGPDPLRLAEQPAAARLADGNFHPGQRWLEATCDGPFPDFVAQIVDYFDSVRSGDLVIFAAEGWDFSRANRGGHGGVGPQDMLVPMIFAGPTLPAGGRIRTARTVDLVPTLLDFLGRLDPADRTGDFDGVSRLRELQAAAGQPSSQPAGR